MKIAIVKLSALGDIIHGMVALQFIKQHYPQAQIDWVVEAGFRLILENNPDIHQIHSVNLKQAKAKRSLRLLARELRQLRKLPKYDVVIDAQGLLKSAIVAKLIPSDKTCGFDKYSIREKLAAKFYNCQTSIGYDQNTIDRNVQVICQPLGIEVSKQQIVDKQAFLVSAADYQPSRQPYVVLIVGSTWESRNYPQEKFAQVTDALGMPCYIAWGNSQEQAKAQWISEHADNAQVLEPLDLDTLKSCIANAALLIGNDTGPTHMAWGLNVPSITLFGPTPVNRIYLTPINQAIKSDSVVNHFKLDKEDYSIQDIPVDNVVKMAKELLQESL